MVSAAAEYLRSSAQLLFYVTFQIIQYNRMGNTFTKISAFANDISVWNLETCCVSPQHVHKRFYFCFIQTFALTVDATHLMREKCHLSVSFIKVRPPAAATPPEAEPGVWKPGASCSSTSVCTCVCFNPRAPDTDCHSETDPRLIADADSVWFDTWATFICFKRIY